MSGAAQRAATERLARICRTPRRRSAVPKRSFLRRPMRVQTTVSRKTAAASSHAEHNGENDPGERGGGGDGAQSPGKKGEGQGESDGGDQWKDGALKDGVLPALKDVHAQLNRTPKRPRAGGRHRRSWRR